MPGVNIGGATYTLSVDDANFVRTLQQAQNVAEARARAIRAQIGALPLGANTQQLQTALAEAEREAQRAAGQIRNSLNGINPAAASAGQSIVSSFAAAGAAMAASTLGIQAVVNALSNVVQSSIAMNATLETTTLQFKTLTGSASEAQSHVQDLFEFARRTPFETQPIIETSRKLRVMGGAALDTKANLEILGDTAAATNAPIEELGFWTGRLFSQAQGGRPFGEASNRLQELGVISGETRNQLEQLQAQGASGDEVFQAYTKSLTQFGGAMDAQAHTFSGLASTFTDNVKLLEAQALAPVFDDAKAGLERLNAAFADPKTQEAVKAFGQAIRVAFVVARDAINEVLGPLQLAVTVIGALKDASDRLAAATGHTSEAMGLLSPIATLINHEFPQIAEHFYGVADASADISDRFNNFDLAAAKAGTAAKGLSDDLLKLLDAGEKVAANGQQIAGAYGTLASGNQTLPIPKAQNDRLVKEAEDTTKQIVAREQEGIRQRQEAYDRGADQAIASAERQRDGLIAASKATHDAALEDIKNEQKAADAAFAVQQRNYERERDAALKAAGETRDGRIAAIKASEAAEETRAAGAIKAEEKARDAALKSIADEVAAQKARDEQEARDRADRRTLEDRQTTTARQQADRAAQSAFDAETQADRDRHDQRQANLKAEAEQAKAASDRSLASLDAEKTALQHQADEAVRGLERQGDAEQRRHDRALSNIDAEAARHEKDIQRQLDILDRTQAAEQRQREDASQQGDVTTARQGLRSARASGDPEAIKSARADLAQAIAAIAQTARDRERDAERTALQQQLQNVQARAQAEKDAADKELAQQQARLAAEKQATQDNLAAALAALATRADAEKASTDTALGNIQKRSDTEKAAYDAHAAADQAAFDADSARIAALHQKQDDARTDARLKEDRAIDDSNRAQQAATDAAIARIRTLYDDPDTGILTKIKQDQDASKARFDAERAQAQQTYDDETARIHDLYDNPDTGLLARVAAAKTTSDDYFDTRRVQIDQTYKDEQDRVNTLYNGPFGLIQRIKDAKSASDAYFDKANKDWDAWGKASAAALDATNPKLDEYIAKLQQIAALGGAAIGSANDPGGFVPGAGGLPLTGDEGRGAADPQLAAAFQAAGLTPDLIAAACGPIAAAGLAKAFGEAGKNINPGEVLKASERSGNFSPSVGTMGFEGVAANAGVHVHAAGQAEALAALKAGNPVVINQTPAGSFPGHYLLAQGMDAGGNLDLGNTGHVVGLGRTASLGQIASRGGGLRYFVPDPTAAQAQALHGGSPPAPPSTAAGGLPQSEGSSQSQVAEYIRAKATALGFSNPAVPVAVWAAEGGVNDSSPGDYNTNGQPSSFGPFQMHYGGLGSPHSSTGLGDDFTAHTGIRPGDPRFERASIDYALQTALHSGWGPWHAWKGDPWAGIAAMAHGGVIDRPSLLLDMKTRRPWAMAGERGPERVTPMARAPLALPPLDSSGRSGGMTNIQQFFGPWTVKADMGLRQASEEVARLYGGIS